MKSQKKCSCALRSSEILRNSFNASFEEFRNLGIIYPIEAPLKFN